MYVVVNIKKQGPGLEAKQASALAVIASYELAKAHAQQHSICHDCCDPILQVMITRKLGCGTHYNLEKCHTRARSMNCLTIAQPLNLRPSKEY